MTKNHIICLVVSGFVVFFGVLRTPKNTTQATATKKLPIATTKTTTNTKKAN